MANEIQFGYRSGATLTYGAYKPDGTVRTAAATSLPEIGTTGYYTATDANVVAGDAIVVKESTNVVGYGIYQPYADINSNIETVVDNLGTPADIDGGGATIADNLKKIADDNGGADFDATTDSLEKIRDKVNSIAESAGTPRLE